MDGSDSIAGQERALYLHNIHLKLMVLNNMYNTIATYLATTLISVLAF